MFNATPIVEAALKKAGLKCHALDLGELSFVEAGFTGENTTTKIRFISSDNDNDIKVMTENIAKVNPAKRDRMYAILNSLNCKYKFAKFTMDDNGGVCAQYDVPISIGDSLEAVALEIALRFAKIVDDAYPEIMKEIWG